MNSSTIDCPFCNSQFAAPTGGPQTVICPQCGERVPVGSQFGTVSDGTVTEATVPTPERSSAPAFGNRQVAFLVLGVMLLIAAVTLTFVIETTPFRRSKDQPQADQPRSEGKAVGQPPAELAALRYIPSNANVLIGLNVSELLTRPTGMDLLTTIGVEAAGDEKLFGLSLASIRRAVIGINTAVIPPQVTISVETNSSIDVAALKSDLKSTGTVSRNGKTIHRFQAQLGQMSLNAGVWLRDDRTAVSMLVDDFDVVPTMAAARLGRFFAEDVIPKRFDIRRSAWVLAHFEDEPSAMMLGALAGGVNPDIQALLPKLSDVYLNLDLFAGGERFSVMVRGKDSKSTAAAGRQLETLGKKANFRQVESRLEGDLWIICWADFLKVEIAR